MRTGTEITKRSRGRPRGFITEEVLEKVRGVFLAKGFTGASLDELSAAHRRHWHTGPAHWNGEDFEL